MLLAQDQNHRLAVPKAGELPLPHQASWVISLGSGEQGKTPAVEGISPLKMRH